MGVLNRIDAPPTDRAHRRRYIAPHRPVLRPVMVPSSAQPDSVGESSAGFESPVERGSGTRGRLSWLVTPPGLTFLVIAAFVVVGGYDRLEALGSVSLWNDESQSTLYALSILQHGYPAIVSPHLINNWEPLYPYAEAVSIALLGKSNVAYRLPSALIGTALIPIAYLVAARLRDRYVGIALAAMVAFSTEYIAWSRQARWYMLFATLLAVGLLAAIYWYHARSPRARRIGLLAMGAAAIGVALSSPGLFLVYVPGILAGLLAFLVTTRWERVRRFFRGPVDAGPSSAETRPPRIPYRYRPWVVLIAVLAIVAALLAEAGPLSALVSAALARLLGFPPYPPVWSNYYGVYLVDYYPAIVALALGSIYFIARKRNPLEIGLVAFCAGAFASVSVLESVTTPIAAGAANYERHIVPLLFALFLLSAITIVGVVRAVVTSVSRRWPGPHALKRLAPAAFGAAVVLMLVVPSVAVPTANTVETADYHSQANSLVPWVPFSLAPAFPSNVYQTNQANYQLASEYIAAHRVPGEVVGATTTGPVAVYLGSVQYWIRGDPNPTTTIYVHGQAEFFYTGSALVNNSTDLEGVLYQSPGWLVSDAPHVNGQVFSGGMNLVVQYFMTRVPGGSDNSISLFHWNQSTPVGLMQQLIGENSNLTKALGHAGLQAQLGWFVTRGVTSNGFRLMLIPLAPYLLPLVTNRTTLGLGVLFNVYNHRPGLQQLFPEVMAYPFNDTQLLSWACGVASGMTADPAYATLAPYETVYCGS